MSLWDVDKEGDKRDKPTLNQNDRVAQRMANATTSVHPVTTDTQQTGYLQTKDGRILVNDGTNHVGLFGFDSNGAMVVKVAQTGYDADTAPDNKLKFNSDQIIFKVSKTFTDTLTFTADGTNYVQETYTHNLGLPNIVALFDTETYLSTTNYISGFNPSSVIAQDNNSVTLKFGPLTSSPSGATVTETFTLMIVTVG